MWPVAIMSEIMLVVKIHMAIKNRASSAVKRENASFVPSVEYGWGAPEDGNLADQLKFLRWEKSWREEANA
jgi:hypothetical protein